MKKVINTYQHRDGNIFVVEKGSKDDLVFHGSGSTQWSLIGTEEREFALPKKMVTRVTYPTNIARSKNMGGPDFVELESCVPTDAKNLRVTYDIEETLPT